MDWQDACFSSLRHLYINAHRDPKKHSEIPFDECRMLRKPKPTHIQSHQQMMAGLAPLAGQAIPFPVDPNAPVSENLKTLREKMAAARKFDKPKQPKSRRRKPTA